MIKKQVLFLCTGNSVRSQMAQGLVNHFLGDDWEASSAGTAPAGVVHPLAIQVMRELGVDMSLQHSKSTEGMRQRRFDLVVTVCDHAAEHCPLWLSENGAERVVHMGFPDPSAMAGGEREKLKAFRHTRDELRRKLFAHLKMVDGNGGETL
jgi:arsenate reductase